MNIESMEVRRIRDTAAGRGSRASVGVARQCLTLWSRWILANILGGTLSFLGWVLAMSGDVLPLFFGSLSLSVAQWLVLRCYLRNAHWWIIASTTGGVIGFPASIIAIFGFGTAAAIAAMTTQHEIEVFGVLVDAKSFWELSLSTSVMWCVIGGAQCLVLRRDLRSSILWVMASSISGAISAAVAVVMWSAIRSSIRDSLLLSVITAGGVHGALTGILLVFLLRNRIKHRLQRQMGR
jgi:hypothetical protein